jgi:DNA repair photolyase
MDLRGRLLELLAPVQVGDQVLPGARLVGASTEAGLRLDFEVGGARVDVEVAPADEPGPAAVRTARLRLYYNGASPQGLALCQAVGERVRHNEARVLDALAAQAAESVVGETRVREVRIDRLLEPAAAGASRYHTLSPYSGCVIGCRFCYAQAGVARVRRLAGLPAAPWGSYADVRVNAPEVLAAELEQVRPQIVKFCPLVSDPYQALESRYRLTRRCLEVLAGAAAPPAVLLLTRAQALVEDVPLLARLPRVWAGVSLPTVDDSVRAHFEPRAASVAERLAVLDRLRQAGVRTHAMVQPLLPGPVDALADALAARADSVRIDVLHGECGAQADFDGHAEARSETWQRNRAVELAAALGARGVPLWPDELPPELAQGAATR